MIFVTLISNSIILLEKAASIEDTHLWLPSKLPDFYLCAVATFVRETSLAPSQPLSVLPGFFWRFFFKTVHLCAVCTKLLQSCPPLCDPMDCSPPGSPVHGILQAGILEWVVMPSSRGSSGPRDWICVSYVSCMAGKFFITSATWEGSPYIFRENICLGLFRFKISYLLETITNLLTNVEF